MALVTPTLLLMAVAWAALAALTLGVFVTGYRREDRHLMAVGFVLAGATGACLDYVVQTIRLAVVFG
jgi:hypothetical protein